MCLKLVGQENGDVVFYHLDYITIIVQIVAKEDAWHSVLKER